MSSEPTQPVRPAPTSTTVFVGWTAGGPVDTPVRVTSVADYRAAFAGAVDAGAAAASPLDHAMALFFANGGADAIVVRAAGPGAEHAVPPSGATGLGAVAERFSVLVLPGLTTRDTRAVERALARCDLERAVLLLDLPGDADPVAAAHHADQVRGARERAAAYHPWLVVGTHEGGTAVPPGGAVAGVLASTPPWRGLGQTPTGGESELRGADGLTVELTGEESELLTVHGVNALRALPDRRRVAWGGRLLSAPTAAEPSSRYLAVRRLTDYVLESLEQGMGFVAERRVDPGVADLARRRAEEFLTEVWRQGALAGATVREAFFVRCDRSTTSDTDLAAGRMVLRLGLATTRPAEFEVHDLVLETVTAARPKVLDAPAAVARATALARERGTVLRRVDLAPLVSGHLAETEGRLAEVFDNAAYARTVLLLQEADTVFGATSDGRGRRRSTQLARILDRLSHDTGVPYVLAARHGRP